MYEKNVFKVQNKCYNTLYYLRKGIIYMYSFNSRIRYSEVDHNCLADLSTIINLFQDCSCFQSEDLGVGVDFLKPLGCAWLLNSWQIIVLRYPRFSEEVTTATWAYNFDNVYGYRNFLLKTASGETLAMANSNWIYVNLKTGHPLRLTSEITDAYPFEPQLTGFEYASRKVSIPKEYTESAPVTIRIDQIDSNQHVNNGQYIKMAEQYLPEDFKIWQMRAEYKQQALLNDVLIPRITLTGQVCTVVLVNTDGKPYCAVEFMQKADHSLE